MCAFGSDGASVMTGCDNGVAKRLTDQFNPWLIAIHCVAHKLALASNDAMDSEDWACFERTLSEIFTHYNQSPKKQGSLREICEICAIQLRKLQYPSKVRWLSRAASCLSVLNVLPALLKDLKAESQKKPGESASNLLHRISNFKWIAQLHFMTDILGVMAMLSKSFQTCNDVSRGT